MKRKATRKERIACSHCGDVVNVWNCEVREGSSVCTQCCEALDSEAYQTLVKFYFGLTRQSCFCIKCGRKLYLKYQPQATIFCRSCEKELKMTAEVATELKSSLLGEEFRLK